VLLPGAFDRTTPSCIRFAKHDEGHLFLTYIDRPGVVNGLRHRLMKHLIISREYPPASYAAGGIGTYVKNIARLMAERGETVHIIGQRWKGAPKVCETTCAGRLIVHRIADFEVPEADDQGWRVRELAGLKNSSFPNQWFAWHAAILAERLIEVEGIDVVEAQDWEAPAYFLLLRRALDVAAKRHPPCIVHLHSPSAIARHFNGPTTTIPSFPVVKRMEDYCIHAADALLCPSNYLARQCEQYYLLESGRIEVIRLPVGFMPFVERDRDTWTRGSICYVGRLEPRKGIIEWLEAAALVALEDRTVVFDFVGADIWGLRRYLVRRLPFALRPRFRFHGPKPHAELLSFLARARAGVVPSRWENFPNVCIEAMSTGLPVIATRNGGMAELIEDGRSGWLAEPTGVAGMVDALVEALRRCLATSVERREVMGRQAADSVRQICDNERTVREQLSFRTEVMRRGAVRSTTYGPIRRAVATLPDPPKTSSVGEGMAVVVGTRRLGAAAPVLESLRRQIRPARALVVVSGEPPAPGDAELLDRIENSGGRLLVRAARQVADAWNAGFASLAGTGNFIGCLFLDEYDRLTPACLERLERVLSGRPEIGIVSFWTGGTGPPGALTVAACPELPYQLMANDVVSASAFRTVALGPDPPFCAGMPRGYDTLGLANKTMAKEWLAVTWPEMLAERAGPKVGTTPYPESTTLRALRAEVLQPFADTLTVEAITLLDLHVPLPLASRDVYLYLAERLTVALLHPTRAARALFQRGRTAVAHLLTANSASGP
jgi:glycogen synthase